MVLFEGKSFEAPKKTMALNDLIESINSAKTSRDSYYLMLEFVNTALGTEKVQELLGTSDINEMDLVSLNLLCNAICSEYEDKVTEKKMKSLEKMMNSKSLENVIQLASMIEQKERSKNN